MTTADFTMSARVRRLLHGPATDPAWTRPALWGVVVLAAILYMWDLTISGWANAYYSAAAQAASQSWSAFFFGSFDAAGFITVDKPPAALWLMGLSVRIFGLSSWSILLPEALCGVATIVVLYLAVRRSFGAAAGVVAALVMALTPVAVAMFRYNNPDALLTLLLVTAAWALVRAIGSGGTRWLVLSAALIGLAFDTKYLQAFIVVPAFVLAFAVAAPAGWRRRGVQLLTAATVLVLSAGWWVAIVELIPAASRPFIGGSTKNSVLDLILGYDGLGRIFGGLGPVGGGPAGVAPGGGAGPGGAGGPGFGGASGFLRMFNEEWGGQIAWLLPAAVVAAIGGVAARWRTPRTDAARAGFLLWGTWLVAHVAVFSLSAGIIHPYYAVVMAPAIAALVGGGLAEWHRVRSGRLVADVVLAATVVGTVALASMLLERTPGFLPGLGVAAIVVGVVAATLIVVGGGIPRGRAIALGGATLALVATLAGPASYVVESATVAYAGGDPTAGPAAAPSRDWGQFGPGSIAGRAGAPGASAENVDVALVDYLLANRGTSRWIVAAQSANGAASIQIATGAPVMAMGGFTGSDPAPTADQLAAYVASGELRYVYLGGQDGPGGIAGFPQGGPGGPGGVAGFPQGGFPPGALPQDGLPQRAFRGPGGLDLAGTAGRLSWVAANCSQVDYGGAGGSGGSGGMGGTGGMLYDCAAGASGG